MVENNIKIMNDLDIQINDLEKEIEKINIINEELKLKIQKKFLILQQLKTAVAE